MRSRAATASHVGPRLVESFSVQLGSQHKTPYNVRLLTSSVAAMLAPVAAGSDAAHEAAYRAQTVLSLYSRSIAGLVVLSSPDVVASAGARGLHPGAARRCVEENTDCSHLFAAIAYARVQGYSF